MKMFRKNMAGFVHHAVLGMVVVGLVSVIGVKVLVGTHALTQSTGTTLTVVKSFKETADGKLSAIHGAKLITDTSSSTAVIQLAGSYGDKSGTQKPQMATWDDIFTLYDPVYKGDNVRICVEVRYPFADGTIAISTPTTVAFENFDVKKSVDNAFSTRCTLYEKIKWSTNNTGSLINQPGVYSWSKTAYVRAIKIVIAK